MRLERGEPGEWGRYLGLVLFRARRTIPSSPYSAEVPPASFHIEATGLPTGSPSDLWSSTLLLQEGTLPAGLAWIGVATAALATIKVTGYLAVVADRSSAPRLLTIGIGAGTLFEAAWFVWLGVELLA